MTRFATCGKENSDEAAFFMACGTPLAPAAAPREVEKTVTALFCDLVGSTMLAKRHDPEVVKPVLRPYFGAANSRIRGEGTRNLLAAARPREQLDSSPRALMAASWRGRPRRRGARTGRARRRRGRSSVRTAVRTRHVLRGGEAAAPSGPRR